MTPTDVARLGIRAACSLVADFHEKLDVSQPARLSECNHTETTKNLEAIGGELVELSQVFLPSIRADARALRAHLIIEELGETLIAMAAKDEASVLDGLADLSYVTDGTAVTHDLPLAEAFIEVHRSNMTKTKQEDDVHSDRVREKGDAYVPPNIQGIIDEYRS